MSAARGPTMSAKAEYHGLYGRESRWGERAICYDICISNGRNSLHNRATVLRALRGHDRAILFEVTRSMAIPWATTQPPGTYDQKRHQAVFCRKAIKELTRQSDGFACYTGLITTSPSERSRGFDLHLQTRTLREKGLATAARRVQESGAALVQEVYGWTERTFKAFQVLDYLVRTGKLTWQTVLEPYSVHYVPNIAMKETETELGQREIGRQLSAIRGTIFAIYASDAIGRTADALQAEHLLFPQVPVVKRHRSENKADEHGDIDALLILDGAGLERLLKNNRVFHDEGLGLEVKNSRLRRLAA